MTEQKDLGLGSYKGTLAQNVAIVLAPIMLGAIVAILALAFLGLITL